VGFFDKIKKSMPGSPVSVAKAMLKIYRSYKERNPYSSQEEAYRYTVETRYTILKTVSQDRIEWILERTNCLSTLVFLTFLEENNLTNLIDPDDSGRLPPLIEQIGDDIEEYFERYAPEESYFGREDYGNETERKP